MVKSFFLRNNQHFFLTQLAASILNLNIASFNNSNIT